MQGAAESVQNVCTQELFVLSDASSTSEDVNNGVENDGDARRLVSTPAEFDEEIVEAAATSFGKSNPEKKK